MKLEPIAQDQSSFQLFKSVPSFSLSIATNGFLHSNGTNFNDNLIYLKSVYREFLNAVDNYSEPFFRADKPINFSHVNANFQSITLNELGGDSAQDKLDPYTSKIECSQDDRKFSTNNDSAAIFARYHSGNLMLLNLDCRSLLISSIKSCSTDHLLNTTLVDAVDIYSPKIIPISLNLECDDSPKIIFTDSAGNEYSNDIDILKHSGLQNPLLEEIIPDWIVKTDEDSYKIKRGTYIVDQPIVLHAPLVVDPG